MLNTEGLVGCPYREDGEPRGQGKYDCWDVTVEMFKREGKFLPEDLFDCHSIEFINSITAQQPFQNRFVECSKDEVPCIVVFKPRLDMITHAGVYLGEGRFIHSTTKKGVCIENLDHPLWRNRFQGFYKLRE